MEAFQAALDGLVKESKEQITHVQEAAASAVLQAHVVPHRIAVAIAQRFTPERVASAYPVLCLMDATLVRTGAAATATATGVGSRALPSVADQALTAVLKELWQLAEGIFVPLHDYGATQSAWRDKCLRLVRRWKQRRLLPESTADTLIRFVEHGAAATDGKTEEGAVEGDQQQQQPNTTAGARSHHDSGEKRPAEEDRDTPSASTAARAGRTHVPPPAATSFTAAQAASFRATLQACLSALEGLPAERRTLYLDIIHAEHFRSPTRAALAFYERLLVDLRREVTTTTTSSASSPPQTSSSSNNNNSNAAGFSNEVDAAHAREALGKLLDQLHTGGTDESLRNSGNSSRGGGNRPGGGATAAVTTAARYVSPIFSDIYAKQPLGQRGSDFGTLQRKAEHDGSHSAFYTSYYPKSAANAQRPFRIPASRQAHGGTVRRWFPSPQEWISSVDMADLTQYASRSAADAARKRTREVA
jgi:hypothetical protein